MLKALVVGVNYYKNFSHLTGCVNDAQAVAPLLERHYDNSINFDVELVLAMDSDSSLAKNDLRRKIQSLFEGESEIAIFYFAGHGHIESTGGYIHGSDSVEGSDGIPLSDIIQFAQNSRSKDKVIILDSCNSGSASEMAFNNDVSTIPHGTTILTASSADESASEINGNGVFTSLLIDALSGGAGNLLGQISPGSIYSHIDQSLGAWGQRPIFKSNVRNFVSLRRAKPPIELSAIHKLTEFFTSADAVLSLDPTFEPQRSSDDVNVPAPIPANNEIFAILQKMNRVNLVVPIDADHMYYAAMNYKSCKLTVLGKHYWRLVSQRLI